MDARAMIDESPVPLEHNQTLDDAMPIPDSKMIVALLFEIRDIMQGVLYHICMPDDEEDLDTEH